MSASSDARPLYFVMNAASGAGAASDARGPISEVLRAAQRPHEFFLAETPRSLPEYAQRAVDAAVRNDGVVVAVGGDGTINTVAHVALSAARPFGVIPQGTFNYVGRAHAIPQDPAEAARALLDARIRPVQVGRVNDRIFLVNASLGLYPQLLQDREAFEHVYGRKRINAMFSALLTIMRGHRQLRLAMECDGVQERVNALTLFVGNNPLQLEQVGLPESEAVQRRRLAGVLVPPAGASTLLWLAFIGALGRLGDSEQVRNFAFRKLIVQPLQRIDARGVKVAFDGEITWMRPPIEFTLAPESLLLMAPKQGIAD